MTTRDFTADLHRWHLIDCDECDNSGIIAVQAASVTIELPCPACERSDSHVDDAAAGWAEQ